MSWMSKLFKAELKDRDYRKGVLPQREKITASKVKPVLLEYFVEEYQTGWYYKHAGWYKHGRYKSVQQARRVIEAVPRLACTPIPCNCKWRIDGVEEL